MLSPREWLQKLEQRDDHVRGYMNLHRSRVYLKSSHFPADDLAPEVLVGLVEVLVRTNEQTRRAFQRYAEHHINPPLILVDKLADEEFVTKGGTIVSMIADEWPATERSLVEHSKVIYFRDFLRSFWGRLTKRLLP